MLENPKERVELLRAGIAGKQIEELYIACNNFKIVHSPLILELVEIETKQDKNKSNGQETAAELSA